MNKLKKFSIITFASVLLAGCFYQPNQEAVSIEQPARGEPIESTSGEPEEMTDEEIDQAIEQDLEADLDQELDGLDQELDAIDQELKSY